MAKIIFTDIERRICIVDNRNAFFHKWVTRKNVIEPSPMIGGHPGGTIQFELGIVEFEDGTIAEVAPHQIKFIDNKVKSIFEQMQDCEKIKPIKISNGDLLILKPDLLIRPEQLEKIRNDIIRQIENDSVVIIPNGFSYSILKRSCLEQEGEQ